MTSLWSKLKNLRKVENFLVFVRQYGRQYDLGISFIVRVEWIALGEIEPLCATTSRKRPPPISNRSSKTPKFSQSKRYI